VKQIAKLIILVIFAQSISLGMYSAGLAFESNDISIHTSAENHLDSMCDEILECDNCDDCCSCVVLLQSNSKNDFNIQVLNSINSSVSLYDLPVFLFRPPRSLHS